MKKMFYFTDVLPFLGKEELALDKLKRNLELFYQEKDKIKLVWHPWSGTREYLEMNNSGALSEYNRIVDEYISAGWGELDESKTMDDAIKVLLGCDAYYGDTSDLVYEAQNAKIPVMLQNLEV